MIFTFDHMDLDRNMDSEIGKWSLRDLDLVEFKETLEAWQTSLYNKGWNSLYLENHDQARVVSRWGNDKEYRKESAKMFALVYQMMQGTPYIYQGQEIGMVNTDFDIEDYQDVEIRNAYKDLVLERKLTTKEDFMKAVHRISRDNARTPMQWNDSSNGGFTSGEPWLKVNPSYKTINVEESLADEDSIFYFYKKLIDQRHDDDMITDAEFRLVDKDNKKIFAYERYLGNKSILIIANFYSEPVDFDLDTYKLEDYRLDLSNYKDMVADGNKISLRPYEAIMLKNY